MMIYSIKIIIIQEKHVDKIHKELLTDSMSKEIGRYVKPIETWPGIMDGSSKVNNKCVDGSA